MSQLVAAPVPFAGSAAGAGGAWEELGISMAHVGAPWECVPTQS